MSESKLIESHLGLVAEQLARFRVPPQVRADLRGEGMLGLVEAERDWRPGCVPFAAFARQRIRWRMLTALRELRSAVSVNASEGFWAAQAERAGPRDDDGILSAAGLDETEASVLRGLFWERLCAEELAQMLGITRAEIIAARKSGMEKIKKGAGK